MLALQLACGGWIAAAVGAAARLGIADLLDDGPRSVADLAKATGTVEAVLARVMTLLAVLDLFEVTADGRYANTDQSLILRSSDPKSVRHFCMLAAGEYQTGFGELLHSLKTGESAYSKAFGGSVYEYMARTPDAAAIYDRAMDDLARPVGANLAQMRDWSGVKLIVDVGGGRGTLLKGLLGVVPHLHGICVDRSDVCARAADDLKAEAPELGKRLSFVPGDFFGDLPAGGDVYLLKNVLHNWNDASSTKILGSIRRRMAENRESRLLILEPLAGDIAPNAYQAMDELMQMVICEAGTAARTKADMANLLEMASFAVVTAEPMPTGHMVIDAILAD